jgi:arsenate reductase (glutaredoxin)
MRDEVTIFHNPECSKCRGALELMADRGIAPKVIEYLKNPPTAVELRDIVRKLGIRPEELVRKREAVFHAKYEGRTLSDDEWIEAMIRDPILIERPIVIEGDRAVIGRPPEKVLPLLDR